MLKPSLQLKVGQTLTMTPQLQQAIRLLQLPVLDLSSARFRTRWKKTSCWRWRTCRTCRAPTSAESTAEIEVDQG